MTGTQEQVQTVAPPMEKAKLRERLELIAQTDEMSPTIQKGDDITVNTEKEFANGDIVLLFDGEKALMRRIYDKNKCVVFTADNKEYEPIICCNDEELDKLLYIGVVTNSRRKI